MNKIFLVLVILITVCSVNSQDNNPKFADNTSIVGVWQNQPALGSGWSNTYLFYPDGTFKFFYSQMDCAKRDVSYSGTYTVIGDALRLTKKDKVTVVGGKLQKSAGS